MVLAFPSGRGDIFGGGYKALLCDFQGKHCSFSKQCSFQRLLLLCAARPQEAECDFYQLLSVWWIHITFSYCIGAYIVFSLSLQLVLVCMVLI